MPSETIVFFRKYTSLAGGSTYRSDPYEVTPYRQLTAEAVLAGAAGTGTATGQLYESSDMLTWTPVGSTTNLSATVAVISQTYPARYVLLEIVVPGSMTVATVWAKGVARDA